ncbi:hypothetical protein SAMN04489732_113180 [Amycolatopsis saalfeldensis]|uniref:Uncharacterized protein n=1 Tax=Amycolatopsis saalfeldensis TaxID=394193 RepID=A0A1H8YCJ2_9PSEU|nr:hypothetical protein SAMN04489732_113180 [Amycolatopsis saalfeldensis]
MRPKGFEPLTF